MVITAHKLREQAKALNLLVDDLEASVDAPRQDKLGPVEWNGGIIKYEKRRKRDEK